MIDIEKAKEQYKKHLEVVDLKDERNSRKVGHMYRVAEVSKEIAKRLGLDEEHIKLAELIGLLHDIGRFEQYMVYGKDKTQKTLELNKLFDHGKGGVDLLKKDNYIRKFIEEDKYDEIILKAIGEHNKFQIPEGLPKEEEFYCKLVRDADKIDIYYECVEIFWETEEAVETLENDIPTQKLVDDFCEKKLINDEHVRKNSIDSFIRMMAFIFDMNFKESFEILKEKDYINKTFDRFDFKDEKTKEDMEKIREIANEYIEEKSKI